MKTGSQSSQILEEQLKKVLADFPYIDFAILFGSVALGRQQKDSDLDIAVAADHALAAFEKISLIDALAESTGRVIDLIDLKLVSEPLLGQILRNGRRLLGSDTFYAELISRHLFAQADFMPYRTRILAERRVAWLGK